MTQKRSERPPVLRGTRHVDGDAVIARTARAASSVVDNAFLDEHVHWSELDRASLPELIAELRDGERAIRELRCRLEALTGDARRCRACGRPLSGRADRQYCGAACRQRGHRGRA